MWKALLSFDKYNNSIYKTVAAKSKNTSSEAFREKPKRKRPGVHAKSKTSKLKSSKNYKKLNRGQGWKIVEIK